MQRLAGLITETLGVTAVFPSTAVISVCMLAFAFDMYCSTAAQSCQRVRSGTCPTSRKNGQVVLVVTPVVLQQPLAVLKLPTRCGRQSVGHPSASSEHAATGDRIRRSASPSFLATEHAPLQQGAQRAAAGLLPLLSWIAEPTCSRWSEAEIRRMTVGHVLLFLELY